MVNPKQNSRPASHNTPVMTRGAVKAQRSEAVEGKNNGTSRSSSISSTDRFELLEKKLLKSLIDVISDKFEEFEERFSSKIEALLAPTQAEVIRLCNEVELLKNELAVTRSELYEVRRSGRLSDAVLTGIPNCPNDNPRQLLSSVAASIGHTLSPYASAFRPKITGRRPARSGKSAPLIVKFSSAAEQREFLQKFKRSGPLKLCDIGSLFVTDSKVYAFESLTKQNNAILRHALRLRKENKLFSVFTRHGEVYVRVRESDSPAKATTLDVINNFLSDAGAVEI